MDYTFLSTEEFLALEKSGDLLESGVYEGKRMSTKWGQSAANINSELNLPNTLRKLHKINLPAL